MYPTTNLQPGMTGDAVKKLQNFLVQQGFMTQAQVQTGYGTYGPQTTQAVTKWQQANNVQAGSNYGYWGPLSIAAAQNSQKPQIQGFNPMTGQYTPPTQVTPETFKPATPPTVNPNPVGVKSVAQTQPQTQSQPQVQTQPQAQQQTQGIPYDPNLAKYGITQELWNQGNANQQAIWATIGNAATMASQTPISSITMQDALNYAQNNPDIIKPYADVLKLDTNAFNQQLEQIKTATQTESQQNQMKFEADRKALAEQSAAAGQAYSGFRGKAQQNLATAESGIVTSSRAQLQKNLNDLTSQFESKYGTKATPAVMANYTDPYASSNISLSGLYSPSAQSISSLSGQVAGGITGSNVTAQKNAVNQAAETAYKQGILPS